MVSKRVVASHDEGRKMCARALRCEESSLQGSAMSAASGGEGGSWQSKQARAEGSFGSGGDTRSSQEKIGKASGRSLGRDIRGGNSLEKKREGEEKILPSRGPNYILKKEGDDFKGRITSPKGDAGEKVLLD